MIPTDADYLSRGALDDNSKPAERIQKVLAGAGVASRRKVEELIMNSRVRVNGLPARIGQKIHPDSDVVEVDGVRVSLHSHHVYYLLNKPKGLVSAVTDPQGRPTVVGHLPPQPRVYPVGRLDVDSEGLILLTNDGDLTQRITHPSGGCEKEYLVHVRGSPSQGALRALREGIELDDGKTSPARVSVQQRGVLKIVLTEGRNRQVRRMCEAVGHPVLRLVRTRIGPLLIGNLRPGKWRSLSPAECRSLERSLGEARRT